MGQTYQKIKRTCYIIWSVRKASLPLKIFLYLPEFIALNEFRNHRIWYGFVVARYFVCTVPYEIHVKDIMHIKHLGCGSIVKFIVKIRMVLSLFCYDPLSLS